MENAMRTTATSDTNITFFQMIDDVEIKERWLLTIPIAGEQLSVLHAMKVGQTIQLDSPIEVSVHQSGTPTDISLTTFGNIPVISRRALEAVSSIARSEAQFLPTTIEGFEAVNLLRSIDCLDEDRSEFIGIGAGRRTRGVWRVVIKKEMVDAMIFRIRSWSGPVIVRRDFRDFIVNSGLSGASFLPVEHS
jgi:hypothetical protein